jgi:hypothetical protein
VICPLLPTNRRKERYATAWSIELRFDPASETRIRELWRIAAQHYGTDYVLCNGVIPHVALLVSEDDLSGTFHELESPSMRLQLDGLGFFSGGETAFLRVARSRELLDYQQATFETATKHNARIHEYYTPRR